MRYIAFLRAINVGGHTVKMAVLKQLFEEMAFRDVDTFIASGNVVFEARQQDDATLEKKIERVLQKALGYEVATFVRTFPEIAALKDPFGKAKATTYVGFLHEPPSLIARKAVVALSYEDETFAVVGREVYWHSLIGMGQSQYSSNKLEKTLGTKTTFRNMNTVERLLKKYEQYAN